MKADPARIAVAVSGSGRSLANFLAEATPDGPYRVVAVIASRPDCKAVEIARQAGLPVFVETFDQARLADVGDRLYAWLDQLQVAWIALAGFLRVFPTTAAWKDRIVNIHPALLPRFGGKGMYGDRVHQAVLASGATETGASVHFVNERYDEGAVIAQITVPVHATDSAHTLADRVFAAECRLYPRALADLVTGKLPLAGGKVLRLAHDG